MLSLPPSCRAHAFGASHRTLSASLLFCKSKAVTAIGVMQSIASAAGKEPIFEEVHPCLALLHPGLFCWHNEAAGMSVSVYISRWTPNDFLLGVSFSVKLLLGFSVAPPSWYPVGPGRRGSQVELLARSRPR